MRARIALMLVLPACMPTFPQSGRSTTSLRMHGKPQDAQVVIDEEPVGSLALVEARGVALPEGTHQVTVEAPGFFPYDKLVVAKPSETKRVDLTVELVPVPE